MITLASKLNRYADLPVQTVDDAIVIESTTEDRCYGMESVARRVWELLESPQTVAELCDKLLQEYDIDPEECRKDVVSFVNDLAAEGLIRVVD